MRGIHLKGMRGKSNVITKLKLKYYLYLLNMKLFKSKEFLRPLSVLPNSTASWCMRVIYTSKAVMKMFGCALSIEKIR
jgi:hypothetical protein